MRHFTVRLAIMATSGCAAIAGLVGGCGSSGGATGSTERSSEQSSALSVAGGAVDGGSGCQATLDALLAAPISPPNLFLGLDLSRDKSEDGGIGTGGLTIDQSGLKACAQWVEPANPKDGPSYPGFRGVALGATYTGKSKTLDPSDPMSVSANVESGVLGQVVLTGSSVTGTMAFHSRVGGTHGKHTYVLGLTPETGSSTAGYVMRDGVDYPADWTTTKWANEIYDGVLATFAPDQPPASTGDCTTSMFENDVFGAPSSEAECLYIPDDGAGNSYLGVRPLGFYMMFVAGTNHTETVYEDWKGGWPSCGTPTAAVERMDWGYISYSSIGGPYGPFIGSIQPNGIYSNPAGMLYTEADSVEGCGGTPTTSQDPGYSAIQWGASGEVEMEFNPATGVAYKVIARSGYKGNWTFNAEAADGGVGSAYVVTPTSITLDGAPVAIDWSTAGKAAATVTEISNAWLYYELGVPPDADCRSAHDCSLTVDDGQGHSTFTISPSKRIFGEVVPGFTVVFTQGTSTPVAIETVNPGGE